MLHEEVVQPNGGEVGLLDRYTPVARIAHGAGVQVTVDVARTPTKLTGVHRDVGEEQSG